MRPCPQLPEPCRPLPLPRPRALLLTLRTAAFLLSLSPSLAMAREAPAFPPVVRPELGRPAHAVTVTVRASAEATTPPGQAAPWELVADGRALAPLPFRPSALTTRAIALPSGTVALIEARGGEQRYVLLLARRGARVTVLDAGRADLSGDPGERRAHLLTVLPSSIEGEPDRVVRGTVSERVAVCGAPVTWLGTQTLDPRTLTFVDAALQPTAPRPPTQTRLARAEEPSAPAPRLAALRFDVASSGAGEASFERAPRPLALTDQDPSTAWVEAESTRGAVAFATGRYDASEWLVQRISLVPLAVNAAAHVRAPEHVDIASQDALLRVQLPTPVQPGQRYVVELDPPLAFRCVSVLLPTPGDARGAYVGLAELAFHSEFDAPDGAQRLLAEVARGGSRGVSAARLLRGLGRDGSEAIARAWPDMTARERRVALRVLSDLASAEPSARSALEVAARDADPGLRTEALEALRRAGAGNELSTLIHEGNDEAAQVLARAIPGRALQVLLPALVAEGGVAREGLRAAIADALTRAPELAVPVAAEWVLTERPVEASALVAEALAGAGPAGAALGTELLRSTAPRASTFAELWRVTVAAAALSADAAVDAWLASVAAGDERWMLRAEATASLHARRSALAQAAVTQLARDDFPRARERAATLLGRDEASRALLLELAQRDGWPRVRAAAVTTLSVDADARALLLGALSDPKARVRLAAVEAFRATRDPRAIDAVAARLTRPNELAVVHRAAARYLGELCAQGQVETLIEVVSRGRRPNAYEPDIETGVVAVAALARLGGPRVTEFLTTIQESGPPEAIRDAAAQGLRTPSVCQGDTLGH